MSRISFPKISLDGVRGVLIDIDNTLYSYDEAHAEALKACFTQLQTEEENPTLKSWGFADFKAKYRKKRDEVTERLRPQGACRSRLFAFQALFEDLGALNFSYLAALKYEELYWSSLIANMKAADGAFEFLEKCKELNVKVCALTDMQAHFQIRKLRALAFDKYIDFLTSSEEVGCEKPSPLMFKRALLKLGLQSEEVIMIGDSEQKDIEGAQACGIRAIKVRVEVETDA